ncbi:hypothetical protein VC218_22610 [Xanthomonas nasturtii]|uniref:hypothetical protein n=1 Tax=Xanthomonas nasturtii TaxID=1843581 RepID=UPI002B229B23|nr:hypothetical protein [Xanthomonas nasturtii]MEA9581574.1 hypothetical protein [Xanthomonas nasturtii]
MPFVEEDFLTDVWAILPDGRRVYPYKGQRGAKKGLFSVNFTNDNKKFQGMTEEQLRHAITSGMFRQRGSIRMLPLDHEVGSERNAFAPNYYRGQHVKEF